jgi:hypothetical protein
LTFGLLPTPKITPPPIVATSTAVTDVSAKIDEQKSVMADVVPTVVSGKLMIESHLSLCDSLRTHTHYIFDFTLEKNSKFVATEESAAAESPAISDNHETTVTTEAATTPSKKVFTSALLPSQQQEIDSKISQNAFVSGSNMNGGCVMTGRPSSRVLAPPGGHTSIKLG